MPGIVAGDHVRAPRLNITLDRYMCDDFSTTVGAGPDETVVQWQMPQTVSSNIIPSPDARTFTVVKEGIWMVEFCVRVIFQGGSTTTGDCFAYAYLRNEGIGGRFCGKTEQSPITAGYSPLLQGRCVRQFDVDDQIEVRVRNSTDRVLGLRMVPDLCHISMLWLQPA